ncbi:MAG TPA: penicillin-binding protein 2 [Candidatus Paceibacterota bacterium]
MSESRKLLTGRARVLSGAFILVAALLIARLYFVQIVHGRQYSRDAMGQYTEQAPEVIQRGSIFFTERDGSLVAAATMQSGWRIAIDPQQIGEAQKLYDALNAVTPIDKSVFMNSAARKSDPYEEIAVHVDDTAATKIRALKLRGVILVSDQWRFYPGRSLAAQAIGFVGYSSEGRSKLGVYGLEKKYETTLSESSLGLYVNPFAEIFTNVKSALSSDPAAHKGSVITSIEPKVEEQLEATLDSVMEIYTPTAAGGIIMDPRTGRIVAIAGRPAFDPNTYNVVADPSAYDNQLVSGRYELGSIMKPLTMAAAIDSDAVSPGTTYDDKGCIERSSYTVCNFDLKARGVIPVQQILNQSLNVGATFLADTMGHATLTRYFRMYGLGTKTGIDLPDEVAGDLSPLGSGRGPDVNYATAAYGQGISVSPIEMIRALSALANGGVLPDPHVVDSIKYESGLTRKVPSGNGPQVLKPETAATVTDMLITVFDTGLLNGKLKMEHYSIAAKTGTAQIPQKGGGYIPGDTYLHSFFGYFPARDPQFIVFLFAIKPQGQKYASATLANPFMDIAKFLINYYEIPPDR